MGFSFEGEIEFTVSYFRASRMSFYGLRLEYALEGVLTILLGRTGWNQCWKTTSLRNS